MSDTNVILTTRTYAGLILFDLRSNLRIVKNMTNSVTPEFAKGAYKVGDEIKVRRPYRFVGGEGIDWDPEPLVDQVTPVTISKTPHVHFMWDSIEKTLSLREAMRLYSKPASNQIGGRINSYGATWISDNALNSTGTPGTIPADEVAYLTAGDILAEIGLPEDEMTTTVINRRMSSKFISGTKGLFNPTELVAGQWKRGVIESDQLTTSIVRDEMINLHTNGTYSGTPLVNGANQSAENGNNGTMTLNTDGWTSGAVTLNVGDRFTLGSSTSATVGGVNSVHPITRLSTGRQQVFRVVNQISDTTGTINMVIAPAITPSGQYQNVDSSPADNAIITVIGTTGLQFKQGIMMNEDAFAFVSVPIHEPEAGMGAKVEQFKDPQTGVTLSHIGYYDGNTAQEKHKFQSLIGFGNCYPEMACVIQSQ